MKNSKFSESQITRTLKEYESGKQVVDICRELKISKNTFYLWKKKYSGMDADLLRRHKELERENSALKKMYAELSLDHMILKEVIEKKL
jgi:putative transposase